MVVLTEAGHTTYSFNSTEFVEFIKNENLEVIGFYENRVVYNWNSKNKKLVLVGQNKLMALKKVQEPYIVKV